MGPGFPNSPVEEDSSSHIPCGDVQDVQIKYSPLDSYVIQAVMIWLNAVSVHFHRLWNECTVVSMFMCVWWPLDAFSCCMVYSYFCFLPWQTQRDSSKTLTELQPETMFIQLLSYSAWGIQSWHLKTLACLQDRPRKSVFLICTMVRHWCRNNSS